MDTDFNINQSEQDHMLTKELCMVDKLYTYDSSMFGGISRKAKRGDKGSSSSSESDTPNKKKHHASDNQLDDISEENDGFDLISEIKGLRLGQQRLERILDTKLTEFKAEIRLDMDRKVSAVSSNLSSQINRLDGQIQNLQQKLNEMDVLNDKVNALETQAKAGYLPSANSDNPVDNTELTVVCRGVTQKANEDTMEVANEIVESIGLKEKVHITGALRLESSSPDQNGLLKISFASVKEKIAVLREKQRLKSTRKFRNVYMRKSMDHVERVIHQNSYMVLSMLPQDIGSKYRITGSGKIVKKRDPVDGDSGNTQSTDNQHDIAVASGGARSKVPLQGIEGASVKGPQEQPNLGLLGPPPTPGTVKGPTTQTMPQQTPGVSEPLPQREQRQSTRNQTQKTGATGDSTNKTAL